MYCKFVHFSCRTDIREHAHSGERAVSRAVPAPGARAQGAAAYGRAARRGHQVTA